MVRMLLVLDKRVASAAAPREPKALSRMETMRICLLLLMALTRRMQSSSSTEAPARSHVAWLARTRASSASNRRSAALSGGATCNIQSYYKAVWYASAISISSCDQMSDQWQPAPAMMCRCSDADASDDDDRRDRLQHNSNSNFDPVAIAPTMSADLFGRAGQAAAYAAFRPRYPAALYAALHAECAPQAGSVAIDLASGTTSPNERQGEFSI